MCDDIDKSLKLPIIGSCTAPSIAPWLQSHSTIWFVGDSTMLEASLYVGCRAQVEASTMTGKGGRNASYFKSWQRPEWWLWPEIAGKGRFTQCMHVHHLRLCYVASRMARLPSNGLSNVSTTFRRLLSVAQTRVQDTMVIGEGLWHVGMLNPECEHLRLHSAVQLLGDVDAASRLLEGGILLPAYIFWSEQFAQHWWTPGGEFSLRNKSSLVPRSVDTCQALPLSVPKPPLLVSVVEAVASQRRVHLLSNWEWSAQMHTMHLNGSSMGNLSRKPDCTHYCINSAFFDRFMKDVVALRFRTP